MKYISDIDGCTEEEAKRHLSGFVAHEDCKCGDWERDQGHNPACSLCQDKD